MLNNINIDAYNGDGENYTHFVDTSDRMYQISVHEDEICAQYNKEQNISFMVDQEGCPMAVWYDPFTKVFDVILTTIRVGETNENR